MTKSRHGIQYRRIFMPLVSWAIAILLSINALYFVLRVSNPVIQADGWYYLQAFLKKAIDHTLTLSDFFLKRDIDDHAAPLFRLLLLINYRYFGLDYILDAVAGCFAAIFCCFIYREIIFSEPSLNPSRKATLSICWIAICALVLSLNSAGVWVWPLVTLENITQLLILLFMVAVWHAHRSHRYSWLIAATLVLGITCDDSAIIAALAIAMAYGLMISVDATHRSRAAWKVLLAIGICILVARIGYAFVPHDYVKHSQHTLKIFGPMLPGRFMEGGWWQWALIPLVLPVYFNNPLGPDQLSTWQILRIIIAALLLLAHVVFWRRALRARYDLAAFAAVSVMLLTYGWIAGIIVWRVSWGGNEYLEQPRYVLLYAGNLIALLLMWASSLKTSEEHRPLRPKLTTPLLWMACLLLLAIQVPQSRSAWHERQSRWRYYATMAEQMRELADSPKDFSDCALLTICQWPPVARDEVIGLLKDNELNIFSPRVRHWHPYLASGRNKD